MHRALVSGYPGVTIASGALSIRRTKSRRSTSHHINPGNRRLPAKHSHRNDYRDELLQQFTSALSLIVFSNCFQSQTTRREIIIENSGYDALRACNFADPAQNITRSITCYIKATLKKIVLQRYKLLGIV